MDVYCLDWSIRGHFQLKSVLPAICYIHPRSSKRPTFTETSFSLQLKLPSKISACDLILSYGLHAEHKNYLCPVNIGHSFIHYHSYYNIIKNVDTKANLVIVLIITDCPFLREKIHGIRIKWKTAYPFSQNQLLFYYIMWFLIKISGWWRMDRCSNIHNKCIQQDSNGLRDIKYRNS